MAEGVYVENDNVITLVGLKNKVSGDWINNATVTVTLYDENDAEVSGQSWPASLAYVSASNGNYRATLEDVLNLLPNVEYTAIVTADGGPGLKGVWKESVSSVTRTSAS